MNACKKEVPVVHEYVPLYWTQQGFSAGRIEETPLLVVPAYMSGGGWRNSSWKRAAAVMSTADATLRDGGRWRALVLAPSARFLTNSSPDRSPMSLDLFCGLPSLVARPNPADAARSQRGGSQAANVPTHMA